MPPMYTVRAQVIDIRTDIPQFSARPHHPLGAGCGQRGIAAVPPGDKAMLAGSRE
jgi:hypothetical protein